MRDVRGYRAYRRLRLGWRLLSVALLGMATGSGAQCLISLHSRGVTLMQVSLSVAALGALLAASGTFTGRFRWLCLFLALNAGILLGFGESQPGWCGFAWVPLLLSLWMGDRWLRSEVGLPQGMPLAPPGCLLFLMLVPFLWPVAILVGSMSLFLYLVFAYTYVASALPRPRELAAQLVDPVDEAMDAITRI